MVVVGFSLTNDCHFVFDEKMAVENVLDAAFDELEGIICV